MIYPITAYGDPVLRKKAAPVSPDYPELDKLIENMFDTMYHSLGVGLAAPQIGLPLRLFVIDGTPFKEDDELDAKARSKVSSLKRGVVEGSPEWDILYKKYYEEEVGKRGK